MNLLARFQRPDSPLRLEVIPVTHARQNCSLVWCAETGRGAVVDPGGEVDQVAALVDKHSIQVERLLVTHCHPDHAGAAERLSTRLAAPVEGPHHLEEPLLATLGAQSRHHGFADAEPYRPARWFADGDSFQVGNLTFTAIHCPGHSPGHMAYFCEAARLAFVGDILFHTAIGWTSGPETCLQLLHSIRRKLFPLGSDVVFVPGHARLSTFGEERLVNPSVSDMAAEDYEHVFDSPRFAELLRGGLTSDA